MPPQCERLLTERSAAAQTFALYVEHFPKFFRVTFLMYLPLIALHIALLISGAMSATSGRDESKGGLKFEVGASASGPLRDYSVYRDVLRQLFHKRGDCQTTIRLVTQLFLSPLRPLQVRTAYAAVKERLKALLVTLAISSIRMILGLILLVIPGVIMFINYSLAVPVVMMEGLKGGQP